MLLHMASCIIPLFNQTSALVLNSRPPFLVLPLSHKYAVIYHLLKPSHFGQRTICWFSRRLETPSLPDDECIIYTCVCEWVCVCVCVYSKIALLQQMTWGTSTFPMSVGSLAFFAPVPRHHLVTFAFTGLDSDLAIDGKEDSFGVRPGSNVGLATWLCRGTLGMSLSLHHSRGS